MHIAYRHYSSTKYHIAQRYFHLFHFFFLLRMHWRENWKSRRNMKKDYISRLEMWIIRHQLISLFTCNMYQKEKMKKNNNKMRCDKRYRSLRIVNMAFTYFFFCWNWLQSNHPSNRNCYGSRTQRYSKYSIRFICTEHYHYLFVTIITIIVNFVFIYL